MDEDGPLRDARQLGEEPLRLSQRVAEEQRGLARVALPPRRDLGGHIRSRIPPENGQRVRRLGDEDVAPQRLERRAGRIRLALVVAGEHPDSGRALDSNLRRTEHVPGFVRYRRIETGGIRDREARIDLHVRVDEMIRSVGPVIRDASDAGVLREREDRVIRAAADHCE